MNLGHTASSRCESQNLAVLGGWRGSRAVRALTIRCRKPCPRGTVAAPSFVLWGVSAANSRTSAVEQRDINPRNPDADYNRGNAWSVSSICCAADRSATTASLKIAANACPRYLVKYIAAVEELKRTQVPWRLEIDDGLELSPLLDSLNSVIYAVKQ